MPLRQHSISGYTRTQVGTVDVHLQSGVWNPSLSQPENEWQSTYECSQTRFFWFGYHLVIYISEYAKDKSTTDWS